MLTARRMEGRVNCSADGISLGSTLPGETRIPRGNNVLRLRLLPAFQGVPEYLWMRL